MSNVVSEELSDLDFGACRLWNLIRLIETAGITPRPTTIGLRSTIVRERNEGKNKTCHSCSSICRYHAGCELHVVYDVQ
jgi:hypothetical protein